MHVEYKILQNILYTSFGPGYFLYIIPQYGGNVIGILSSSFVVLALVVLQVSILKTTNQTKCMYNQTNRLQSLIFRFPSLSRSATINSNFSIVLRPPSFLVWSGKQTFLLNYSDLQTVIPWKLFRLILK